MKNSELSALLERKVHLDKELEEWEKQAKIGLQKIIEWADKNKIPKSIIPRDTSKLFNKNTLILDNLELDDLPEEIGFLINLKRLTARNNNLKKLPDSLCYLNNLESLYLENNKLRALPNKFANLDNLCHCYLRNSCLKTIPDDIAFMKSLHSLDLVGNPLESLPPNLDKLRLPPTGKRGMYWYKLRQGLNGERLGRIALSEEKFNLIDREKYKKYLENRTLFYLDFYD